MAVGGSKSRPMALDDVRMLDLAGCDPASGELSQCGVDVVTVENHEGRDQFVLGDFSKNQSLYSNRTVDLAVVAEHRAA